jgi:RES domain-containing protein
MEARAAARSLLLRITAWRITKQRNAKTSFSGAGARLYGGRWNSPGTIMIYTAQSQSLAALEMLVHVDSSELLGKYVFFEVGIDESFITDVEISQLPKNWRADPAPAKLRTTSDDWVAAGTSAVLRVPSALVPSENNFLLNPRHPDFPKFYFGKPLSFRFDPRLAEKS